MKIMEGTIIMIVCVVAGGLLALFGGLVLDNIYSFFELGGLWNNIPTAWQTTGTLFNITNLYYLSCILIALMGVVIFLISVYENEANDHQQTYYG